MMPVLRVSDPTFANLSTLKVWFGTKTPGDTIEQLVREAMDRLGVENDEGEASAEAKDGDAMEFDAVPGLAFTKPFAAMVNGEKLDNPRWSGVLLKIIRQLKAKGLTGEKLARDLQIPTKPTQYAEEGYKHFPDLDISIQGQSAADAWKEIDRIAKKWRIPVVVEFKWRQNSKAQFPGKAGVLRSGQ